MWMFIFYAGVAGWGTMTFLGVVARCIENQRVHLERIREQQNEASRRETANLLVANPISINA